MTIRDLIQTQPTESQYEILQRADRIGLPAGRYYMGQLLPGHVRTLTDGVEIRRSTKEAIDRVPCIDGHVWSNDYGDDWTPDEDARCDCGEKQWKRYGL